MRCAARRARCRIVVIARPCAGELLLPYVMGQIMAAATPAAFGPVLLATILCAVACFGAVMLAARGRCCAAKRVLPVS